MKVIVKQKNIVTFCTRQCFSNRFVHVWHGGSQSRIVDTCKIFGSSCPRRFVDDPCFDGPYRSKSKCGPTNGQAVDSPRNAVATTPFPSSALTNVTQGIARPVHSSHAGLHAKAVTTLPTTLRNSFRNTASIYQRTER